MPGNSFGKLFKISTFGESHGNALGVVIDGCPPGLSIDQSLISKELKRRKPGQSKIVTQRKEADEFEILSGIFNDQTTGTPIALIFRNKDARSKDYSHIKDKFRPSHADYTYQAKYGIRDYRGGGRSSARETVARVAAGAIAKQLLSKHGITVNAFVSQVGHLKLETAYEELDFQQIESNIVRCPDLKMAEAMEEFIKKVRKQGDTVGGAITCVIQGFEIGSGFSGVEMFGSDHNDQFTNKDGKVVTTSNFSGGVQGGISNGMDIYFKAAFKPVATIVKAQDSVNEQGEAVIVEGKGRHDPCVVPRAVPIVEAMAALVIADALLLQKAIS